MSIRLGDGLGGFSGTTEVSVDFNPFHAAVGDFNNDGKQDVIVVAAGASKMNLRLGDGSGGFVDGGGSTVGSSPRAIAVGDFNEDGTQDFASSPGSATFLSVGLGGCGLLEVFFANGFE
ncbi:MAG: VCBS repeat-containing protein [Xanthomonadales bacterium]|nr:VCBS repeat-containing protein [Xanthomonadales bacterium]